MKTIYNNCLLLLAALLFLPAALHAQDEPTHEEIPTPPGVHLDKYVNQDPDDPNKYTVTLEAFVTGGSVATEIITKQASDIVLVFDVSGSMSENYRSTTLYTPVAEASYSARSFGVSYGSLITEKAQTTRYYFKHTDGNFYPVKVLYKTAWSPTFSVWAYYEVNGTKWYLQSDGTSSTKEHVITRQAIGAVTAFLYSIEIVWDPTLFRGVLYRPVTNRMEALQASAQNFLDVIYNDAVTNGNHHKVSIVKFADNSYYKSDHLAEGNNRNSSGYNYSQVVKNFMVIDGKTQQKVDGGTEDVLNHDILVQAVDELVAGGATAADYGLSLAKELFAQDTKDYKIKNDGNKKIVIFFTDGEPNHSSDFDGTVARTAIGHSKDMKNNKDNQYGDNVTVYSIGLLSSPSTNVRGFMNGVSSNYPNATNYNALGAGSDKGYFFIDNSSSLMDIFKTIAEQIVEGGADYPLGPEAEVRDIMSSSFMLPDGTTTVNNDVTISVASLKEIHDTDDGPVYVFNSPSPAPYGIKLEIKGNKEVIVSGFNFSENYVGYDIKPDKTMEPHGNKLIITFSIVIDPDGPRGFDVPTNDASSGIYVGDEPIAVFTVPTVKLPNLVIVKSGLHAGESAIFTVECIESHSINDITGETIESPFKSRPVKVVVTCEKEGEPAIANVQLNVGRFKVTEDSWSWSYNLSELKIADYTKDDKNITDKEWAQHGFYNSTVTTGKQGYKAVMPTEKGTTVGERSVTRNVNEFTEVVTDLYTGVPFIFRNEDNMDAPAHAESLKVNEFYERPLRDSK